MKMWCPRGTPAAAREPLAHRKLSRTVVMHVDTRLRTSSKMKYLYAYACIYARYVQTIMYSPTEVEHACLRAWFIASMHKHMHADDVTFRNETIRSRFVLISTCRPSIAPSVPASSGWKWDV